MSRHHHAYRWAGAEFPNDASRRDETALTPPMVRGNWLLKPVTMHRGMYETPRAALNWFTLRLDVDQPTYTEIDPSVLEQSAAVKVTVGGDFTTSFRAKSGNIVALALIACPRDGIPCPGPVTEKASEGAGA